MNVLFSYELYILTVPACFYTCLIIYLITWRLGSINTLFTVHTQWLSGQHSQQITMTHNIIWLFQVVFSAQHTIHFYIDIWIKYTCQGCNIGSKTFLADWGKLPLKFTCPTCTSTCPTTDVITKMSYTVQNITCQAGKLGSYSACQITQICMQIMMGRVFMLYAPAKKS